MKDSNNLGTFNFPKMRVTRMNLGFSFVYPPSFWYLNKSFVRNGVNFLFTCRFDFRIKATLRVVKEPSRQRSAKNYFETDILAIQKKYGPIEVINEQSDGNRSHLIHFYSSDNVCIRNTIIDDVLTFVSVIGPKALENLVLDSFHSIFDDLSFFPSTIPLKKNPEFFFNFFRVSTISDCPFILGDIFLLCKEPQGFELTFLSLTFLNGSNAFQKVIFQRKQIRIISRLLTESGISDFSDTCPSNGQLVIQLPCILLNQSHNLTKIRINVKGFWEDGKKIDIETFGGVIDCRSEHSLIFPTRGRWLLINDPWFNSLHEDSIHFNSGRIYKPQKTALDLIKINDEGIDHIKDGTENEHYFAFGEIVVAPFDGIVYERMDGIEDNLLGDRNYTFHRGNYIILKIRENRFLLLAHLQKGSIAVDKGEKVFKNQPIARVGNSGQSSQPHLHIHLSDTFHPNYSQGIPIQFEEIGFPTPGQIVYR